MAPSTGPPALPSTAQPHRDAAYRFVVGGAYFAVISGLGSLAAVLFGPFGVVVSVLVSLVGVYYGGIEVARGVDVVVRHAMRAERGDEDPEGRDHGGRRGDVAGRSETDERGVEERDDAENERDDVENRDDTENHDDDPSNAESST